MSDPGTAVRVSHIGTVVVPVSDQDRAIEFFADKLGFEKRADVPMGRGMRWVEVAPAGAQSTVAIVPPREGEPTGVETRIAFATGDVDADHASLKAKGVDVDEEIMRFGEPVPPMFMFRDPDGNGYLIVQRED